MYAKLQGRLTNKQGKTLKKHHHISLDVEFRNDCQTWISFLLHQQVVNQPFTDFDKEVEAVDIGFSTDASRNGNLGFGCYFNKKWTFGRWEPGYIERFQPSIAYLELYALCIGLITWRQYLKNGYLLIHCDNQAVVEMVNDISSSCKNCMYLLRILMLENMLCNRKLRAKYISTKNNFLADLLSRQKIQQFFNKAPKNVNKLPCALPLELWPASKIWQS